MPRQLRTLLPDGFFHVTSRGVEQRLIFFTDGDRRDFLELLGAVARRHRWCLHALCLMGNR